LADRPRARLIVLAYVVGFEFHVVEGEVFRTEAQQGGGEGHRFEGDGFRRGAHLGDAEVGDESVGGGLFRREGEHAVRVVPFEVRVRRRGLPTQEGRIGAADETVLFDVTVGVGVEADGHPGVAYHFDAYY